METSTTAIRTLLDSTDLSTIGCDSTTSEFWKREIAKTRIRAETLNPATELRVRDVVRLMGYGFTRLPDGKKTQPHLNKVLKTLESRTRPFLKQAGHRGSGLSSAEWEHLCNIAFLVTQGLLDEYRAFIRPFRIRSNMATARFFYYSKVIEGLVASRWPDRRVNVLEVGAGAGSLALFLLAKGIVANYVIVDLKVMRLNAAVHLRDHRPGVRIRFDEPPTARVLGSQKTTIHLIGPEQMEAVPPGTMQLLLNFNSFMEMDEHTRDHYIREMYRVGTDRAIFYNSNRRQRALPQPDGSTFDNNPLLYPYDPSDELLFWEEDPIQTAARSWFLTLPSLAINRASIIRKRTGMARAWAWRSGRY